MRDEFKDIITFKEIFDGCGEVCQDSTDTAVVWFVGGADGRGGGSESVFGIFNVSVLTFELGEDEVGIKVRKLEKITIGRFRGELPLTGGGEAVSWVQRGKAVVKSSTCVAAVFGGRGRDGDTPQVGHQDGFNWHF